MESGRVALAGLLGRCVAMEHLRKEMAQLGASEMWLTSSTKEVLAVTTVDGAPFAGGRPGPVFRKMHALFQAHKPR